MILVFASLSISRVPARRKVSFGSWAFPIGVLAVVATLAACGDLPTEPPPESEGSESEMTNLFRGAAFFVDPSSNASRQAAAWRDTRPADAAEMNKIASRSQADWFGDWNGDVRNAVDRRVSEITAAGALPVLVAYNIPQRDCGGLSGGGGADADDYRQWVEQLGEGIGNRAAVVVLEPDALGMLDCLSSADRKLRLHLLTEAVRTLKALPHVSVYLDAGHAGWHSASVMSERLLAAGLEIADGFSLNVSNFVATGENVVYGETISKLTGEKRFVIDTSRNGRGAPEDGEWCNPKGRGLGAAPTAETGHPLIDAFLWIKRPGESDGACNGGPAAGEWWAEYALSLARLASL